VAKILVADDNSNVQKTVALALAELGVEVVSVNNGEAAVRKLADFSPDLVLADIFMPVRNGYEVCEYVKKDPRFAQVPVVLLVGAFDPLDEREAQRVRADGILKKPFVPPDPLITMVKTLLERTLGERLVAVTAAKPAAPVQAKTETVAAVVVAPRTELPSFEEPPENEPPAQLHSAAFDEGERPVAFGQLLETSPRDSAASTMEVVEPIDNEQVLTSTRDANLGDPIFWRNEEPEQEVEPLTDIEEASGPAGLETESWKQGDDSPMLHAESEELPAVEHLELIREGEDEPSHSVVDSGSILLDAAAQAPLTVESRKAEDLAANPIEWMATAPPVPAPEPIMKPVEASESKQNDPIPEEPQATDEIANLESAPVQPVPVAAFAHVPEQVVTPVPAPVFAPVLAAEKIAGKTPDPAKTQPSIPAITQSAEDTAHSIPKHDWAELSDALKPIIASLPSSLPAHDSSSLELGAGPNSVPPSAPASAMTTPEQTSGANAEMVETVVQRVLDKMRPQVVEIITKEFLRPIVQALVQREMDKP